MKSERLVVKTDEKLEQERRVLFGLLCELGKNPNASQLLVLDHRILRLNAELERRGAL